MLVITEATVSEYPVAAQIHAVTRAAYTLEAKRIGCVDFPPLRESLDDLRQSSDRFLVFLQSERIIGALSFEPGSDSVTITRIVVSPAHLRQGIATALLSELEQRLSCSARITVCTAAANTPAVNLYTRVGYTKVAKSDSLEGIPILHFYKFKRDPR